MADSVLILDLTQDDVQTALIEYAARKLGARYPLTGNIKIHGSWMQLGDSDHVVTVTLTEHTNVVPLRGGHG